MTHFTRGTVYVSRAWNRRKTGRLIGGAVGLVFIGAAVYLIAGLLIPGVTS